MSSVSTISSNLMKKSIPLYSSNSTRIKASSLLLSYNTTSLVPNPISISGQLLAHDSSDPSEIFPGKSPPEFPIVPNYQPSYPPEVPELPTTPELDPIPPERADPPPLSPGPDFPGPPIPSPPIPDIPMPPPDILPPQPPDVFPPRPPEILPPPLMPPDIQPPMGPSGGFVI